MSEDLGQIEIKPPKRFRFSMIAAVTLAITIAGGIAKGAFHVAGVDARLKRVEIQLDDVVGDKEKDSLRLRRVELMLCELCTQSGCKSGCADSGDR